MAEAHRIVDVYGQHAELERSGCRIHYWVRGPEAAPVVVLSHAALVDHTLFVNQVPALAERFRVLTWDIRGHGQSRPLEGPFLVPDATADLVAILDGLGVGHAVMLGHSMGSYVAQELTFRHPERVTALIVIDGTCITADPGRLGRLALRWSTPMLKLWPYGSLKRSSVARSAEEESTREFLRHQFEALTKSELVAIMDGVVHSIHPEPAYALPVPSLLILGAKDRTGDMRSSMPAWAARDPKARLAVVAGAGHCANYDRPAETNALVLDFLDHDVPAHGPSTRPPGFGGVV